LDPDPRCDGAAERNPGGDYPSEGIEIEVRNIFQYEYLFAAGQKRLYGGHQRMHNDCAGFRGIGNYALMIFSIFQPLDV
jgi:hypothetical protein